MAALLSAISLGMDAVALRSAGSSRWGGSLPPRRSLVSYPLRLGAEGLGMAKRVLLRRCEQRRS
jgi:hypothetical protein